MKKVGILSPSGTGNLGDEATVAVLIEEIRSRYPQAEIYGLTTNPADTEQRHKITAYPARNVSAGSSTKPAVDSPVSDGPGRLTTILKKIWLIRFLVNALRDCSQALMNAAGELQFLAKSFRRVKGTDLMIVAGSGQLCDNFYGVWGFPYTLLKWSIIARLSGAKLRYLSCGAGPIDSLLSRAFLKAALLLADYRSFRDTGSRNLVEGIGVGGHDPVFPDLVFSSKLNGNRSPAIRSRVIAINPFPHCDYRYWPVSEPHAYASYLERLASVASALMKNNYVVLFFPTQIRADALVIEDLKRILMKDHTLDLSRSLIVTVTATIEDLILQLSMADMVVATRFHGVLISFLLNKPVLALSHHPKVDDLMRDMGQSDFLLDIDTFDSQTVAACLASLDSRRDTVKKQIESKVAACRGQLESQYRDAFAI